MHWCCLVVGTTDEGDKMMAVAWDMALPHRGFSECVRVRPMLHNSELQALTASMLSPRLVNLLR